MAEYVELYMDQGVDFSTTIAINNDDNNTAINTGGFIVTSQLRKSLLSVNATASFQCSISDPANGEFTIFMTAANTANIKAGNYFFDVSVKDLANVKSRLIEGMIYVTPSITK
jgi:hypothetical protein